MSFLRGLLDLIVAVIVCGSWFVAWAHVVRSNLLLLLLAAFGYYLAGRIVDRMNRFIDARLSLLP